MGGKEREQKRKNVKPNAAKKNIEGKGGVHRNVVF